MVASNWNWWRHPPSFGLRARFDGQSSRGLFAEDDEPRIGVIRDESQRPIGFEAVGLSHQDLLHLRHTSTVDAPHANVFAVFAVNASATANISTVVGTYTVRGSRLTFVPLHPLLPDVTYRAVLHIHDRDESGTHTASAVNIEHEIEVPRSSSVEAET